MPSLECAILFDAVQVGALAQAAITLLRANLPRPFNLSLLNLGGSNFKSDPPGHNDTAWPLPGVFRRSCRALQGLCVQVQMNNILGMCDATHSFTPGGLVLLSYHFERYTDRWCDIALIHV